MTLATDETFHEQDTTLMYGEPRSHTLHDLLLSAAEPAANISLMALPCGGAQDLYPYLMKDDLDANYEDTMSTIYTLPVRCYTHIELRQFASNFLASDMPHKKRHQHRHGVSTHTTFHSPKSPLCISETCTYTLTLVISFSMLLVLFLRPDLGASRVRTGI